MLADAGADVAAAGRDTAGLSEITALVRTVGRKWVTISTDTASVDGPTRAAHEALNAFGTIDILVNSAGIAHVYPLLKASIEDWDLTMAVNLREPFQLARAVVPKMIEQRAGKIINVSSQAGVIGVDDHEAYCASKGG